MNVLIVGAGPTGLTAAIEFARQGILPDIVEKRTAPSELSRAVGIMPETIDKLRSSGVGDALEKESMRLSHMRIHQGETQLLHLDFDSLPNQPHRVMSGLPQNRTESIMAEALENFGVSVRFGCELTDIENSDQQVTAHFSNAVSKTYDWVIAADGLNSFVREKIGIKFPGIDLDEEWSIADVDVDGYNSITVSIWIQRRVNNKGIFNIILPIEKNRVRIVSSTPDALETMPIKLEIKNIRRTGKFKISIRQAETYQKGRVLLAGDAAHCHSPVGGRGMNLGIDDAIAAVKAVIEGTTESYSAARHAKGKEIIRSTEIARKIIMSKNYFARLIVRIAMFFIRNSKAMQLRVLKQITTL